MRPIGDDEEFPIKPRDIDTSHGVTPFRHHFWNSDAEAAYEILLTMQRQGGWVDFPYEEKFDVKNSSGHYLIHKSAKKTMRVTYEFVVLCYIACPMIRWKT